MNKFFIFIFIIAISFETFGQNRRSSTSTTPSSTKPSSSKTKATTTTSEETIPKKTTKTSPKKTTKVTEEAPTESTPKISTDTGGTSFFSPQGGMSGMSTVIEFGAYPSDADLTLINIYGHLGLNFDIKRSMFIGPYFKNKIMSTHEYQVISIEGKIIDVASFNEWGAGISTGAYFPIGRTILLTPEFRVGYNEYNMQDVGYNSTNKNFINHTYLSAMPRLNIGFKLSGYSLINLSGGYILPYYLKGNKTEAYDPGTFMYGIGMRFYMQKQ